MQIRTTHISNRLLDDVLLAAKATVFPRSEPDRLVTRTPSSNGRLWSSAGGVIAVSWSGPNPKRARAAYTYEHIIRVSVTREQFAAPLAAAVKDLLRLPRRPRVVRRPAAGNCGACWEFTIHTPISLWRNEQPAARDARVSQVGHANVERAMTVVMLMEHVDDGVAVEQIRYDGYAPSERRAKRRRKRRKVTRLAPEFIWRCQAAVPEYRDRRPDGGAYWVKTSGRDRVQRGVRLLVEGRTRFSPRGLAAAMWELLDLAGEPRVEYVKGWGRARCRRRSWRMFLPTRIRYGDHERVGDAITAVFLLLGKVAPETDRVVYEITGDALRRRSEARQQRRLLMRDRLDRQIRDVESHVRGADGVVPVDGFPSNEPWSSPGCGSGR